MPDQGAANAHDDGRIAALAKQITGEWPHIMAVWEEFRTKHGIYLRAELNADRNSFLEQALWSAIGSGHLGALLTRLSEKSLTGGNLHAAATPLLGAGFTMQSFVNGAWQPQNALINGRRLMEACDHVCRISIDGKHRGTGILIRPTIVATAAHVVASLVGPNSRPLPNSISRLTVSFFDADDLMPDGGLEEAKPILGKVHEDWLAYHSPRAPGEGEALYAIDCVTGISEAGPWDLALLRLAESPRPGLTGHRLWQGQPPAVEFGVHVLHHPADAIGAPLGLVWSIGSVKHALGGAAPLRWLHDANTDQGSSGAPCFDNNWRVVALHQAGPTTISAANQNNRAVPIYPWAQMIDRLAEQEDGTPYLAFAIDEKGQAQPVFGRRQLQGRAWRAMSSLCRTDERSLLVLGDARSGRTFTVSILAELAKRAACRFVSLDARNVQNDSPLQFAQKILGAVGAGLQENGMAPSALTTDLRDLRNEILPRLVAELEAIAGERPLWLVLDGLEVCDTVANGVAQLVEALLAGLDDTPHLNLGLIGWQGDFGGQLAEVLPGYPSTEEVVDHLLLDLTPPGSKIPQAARSTFAMLINNFLQKQPPGEPYARAAAAATAAREMMRPIVANFAQAVVPPDGERTND